MHRLGAVVGGLFLLGLGLPLAAQAQTTEAAAPACPDRVLCVGVGIADATWRVGAGAGQYAGETDGSALTGGDADPQAFATKSENSYGVQSRLSMRAVVVRGSNGKRMVLLKTDNYLAQNQLMRRVGQLLAEAGSSIKADDILHSASHNHSSPYYSTPSVGVWVFQDAIDLRAFEYQARAIRDAIVEGERNLAAARMGATTVEHSLFKSNVVGPAIADDGSPAGYPRDFGDNEIAVMRFDSVATGEPLAAWVNHGQHPESLDSYQLISADYIGPLERMVQDDLGVPLVFSQGDVGSAEGPSEGRRNATTLPDGTVRAFSTPASPRPSEALACSPTRSSRAGTPSAPAAGSCRPRPTSPSGCSPTGHPARCRTRTPGCPRAAPNRRPRARWACPTRLTATATRLPCRCHSSSRT